MIKWNFFKVWLLRNTFACQNFENQAISNKHENFLTFESGHCLSKQQIETVYDVSFRYGTSFFKAILNLLICLHFKVSFVEKVQEFLNVLFELKLNDIEIGILSALLLTSTSLFFFIN